MSRSTKLFVVVSLATVFIWVAISPHRSIEPGNLSQGHAELEANCLSCHSPFRGARSERCATCHKPIDIGRLTTKGHPITRPIVSQPFHHKITQQNCMACHREHAGVRRLQQPIQFKHELLESGIHEQCQDCHKVPTDSLHQNIVGNCGHCHTHNKWVPATFNHDKHFVLDSNHSTRCVTCHVGNDYKKYTCYGCHEHEPAQIRAEHSEEGIKNFNNCVECHQYPIGHEGDDD